MSVVIAAGNVRFFETHRIRIVNLFKSFLLACVLAGITYATDLSAATSSNTIVRIEYRHGQVVWAKMDVELFDTLKPLTVSNFLYYVRNGSYDRTILHRVVPGFIIQGGQYTVQNPYAQSLANYMNRIVEGPAIASEATNSPIIPNTFGTIAMALSGDGTNVDRNSATTSWYININDNTVDLPEYTVFGRVKSGAKYLGYFDTISEDFGLLNMFGLNYLFSVCDLLTIDSETDIGLPSLPVFYWYFDCPYYSDLFNIQISIIKSVEDGADNKAPKLKVVYPTIKTVITNDFLTVTGTVTDVGGLSSVRVFMGSNQPVTATLNGTAWSADFNGIPAGTNSVLVEATDEAGNRVTASTKFFFQVPMVFQNNFAGDGTGTITGITNGQSLEVGRIYTITAMPAEGNFFSYWQKRVGTNEAVIVSGDLNYRFYMETNLSLLAVFATNLFPYVKGTYHGLLVSTNLAEHRSSGHITVSVNEVGTYSGKLLINGATLPLSGAFTRPISTNNTAFENLLNEPGLPGFTRLNLVLNLQEPANKLTGWMTNLNTYITSNYVTTNLVFTNLTTTNTVTTNYWNLITNSSAWANSLTADRVLFNAKTNPAPQAGTYTLVFPTDTNSPSGPGGDGYGTVKVTTAGAITFAGVLADGTKAAQKTFLSADGNWPLYIPLYKTNGSLISWVNFDDEAATTDFSGLFNWFKQSDTAKYYAAGFTNEATLLGSKFTKPNTTNQMLFLTNATVSFTGGNLVEDFTNSVTLDPKGKVTNLDANALKLSINSGKGLISGSVTPPSGGKPVKLTGAILQKGTNASGFFLGTNASGRFLFGP